MEKTVWYESLAKRIPGIQSVYNAIKKRRYAYLYQTIRERRSQRLMEIGLWDGAHALRMIETAKRIHGAAVEYYGFDLFEEMNQATHSLEASKYPLSQANIQKKLEWTGCAIHLYKGPSQQTLPPLVSQLPKMDLIFIDGGHSLETIESDWRYCQELMHDATVVIFDDYWNRDDVGCKPLVEKIDRMKYNVEILPIQDRFKKDWGTLTINFVKVTRA